MNESDFHALARRVEAHGTKVGKISAEEQSGLGRRLSFIVPTGHRVDLFAEIAPSDVDGIVKLFTEVFDFSLTEAAETPDGIATAVFSYSNKAHHVAFTRRREPAGNGRMMIMEPPPARRIAGARYFTDRTRHDVSGAIRSCRDAFRRSAQTNCEAHHTLLRNTCVK